MIYRNDPAELPVVDAPSYWDSSEKDYRKVQNLIRGLTPRITAGDEDDVTAGTLHLAAGVRRAHRRQGAEEDRLRRKSGSSSPAGSRAR